MPITLSIVVPVYSGAPYLQALIERINSIRETWAASEADIALEEVIFVDDQSIDDSAEILADLSSEHSWVSVLTLARNFGQHPATAAGILHTSGDWVATIDEDLQHPPEDIIQLMNAAALASHDVVYANAIAKVHKAVHRDFLSKSAKRLAQYASGNPHIEKFNSFRLMRGAAARAAASVCGYDTYFDVALSWFTTRVASLPLDLQDRRAIGSSYSLRKLLSHGRRLFMSGGTKAIRIAGIVGLASIFISVFLVLYILVAQLVAPGSFGVRGWASLFAALSFFAGLIIFQLTIALEFLGLLVSYRQGRPTFFAIDRTDDQRLLEACREILSAPRG